MGPVAARAAFAAALVVQLVVLYSPEAGGGGGIPGLDKAVHLGVFALAAWTGRLARLPVVPLLAVLAGHAVLSEVVQATLLPHRDGDPVDALADLLGLGLGAVIPAPRRRARRRPPGQAQRRASDRARTPGDAP